MMKKITFGTPENLTPTKFCKNFTYDETEIKYPVDEISFETNVRGCLIKMPLDVDEQIYGLGLQLKGFSLRGRKQTMRSNADPMAFTGDSHAPVPFFVSTKGYGMFLDTARNAEFYFGSSEYLRKRTISEDAQVAVTNTDDLYGNDKLNQSNISIQIPHVQGVDICIIEGDTITDIVAKYNKLAGGGCNVPEWGLSPIYRCYVRYTGEEVLKVAKQLKDEDFPVGIIGFEPGWQSHSYACSLEWNKESFPNPQEVIDNLKSMGYHVNLWEHAFVYPTSSIYDKLLEYSGDYEVWTGCVPDFAMKEAREIFANHHKKLVEMGVDGFKLDECDGSDLTRDWSFPNHSKFPSGLDGEQYHHLIGTLYTQTIMEALEGTPTFSQVRNLGALAAPYPFVLYSDLYDHKDFIRGCATAGFSGLLWSPEVRDTLSGTKEEFIRRLQVNVFSVQCLINAWYCEAPPWEELDCADETRHLLKERERLLPRLKKAFERYAKDGVPPMRALVSDYTDDKETYVIDDEYLLCEDLLVAPIVAGEHKRNVYLPEGKWEDYYTGESVKCGWFEVETENIPVFVKKNMTKQLSMTEQKKQFPTPAMLKAQEEWEKKTSQEKEAIENRNTRDHSVARAIEFIHQNFKRNFSGSELALYCSQSISHLRVKFKRDIGMSIVSYRDKLRITIAREMLGSNLFSIKETAYELGYSDVYHFTKAFTKAVGIPPARYIHELRK